MEPITTNPEIMSGTPCFTGTRVPVKNLFDYLARDYSVGEFLLHFSTVDREQVIAILELAKRRVMPPA